MAKLLSSDKYHPSEWHTSNQTNFTQSETARTISERLRAECNRLQKEADDTTKRVQREVEHKFSQRIKDIEFWKEELEKKLSEINQEIHFISDSKIELEKAIKATNFPLEVARTCLMYREKRQSIDLVHDEVEIQLLKEVEVIEGIQNLLQKTFEETVEQIRLLRCNKYNLEKDLKDKYGALNIDKRCADLVDTAANINYSPAAVKIQPTSLSPNEWQSISDENIRQAERERIASTTIRGVIACLLDETREDMIKQRKILNSSFYKRIQEVTDAKTTLENHLNEVRSYYTSMAM
jgi:tektin-1